MFLYLTSLSNQKEIKNIFESFKFEYFFVERFLPSHQVNKIKLYLHQHQKKICKKIWSSH